MFDPAVQYRLVSEDVRYAVGDDGSLWSSCRGAWRRLKTGIRKDGYRMVVLGRNRPRYLHRVILEAFVGPCPEGCEACHYNDDRADNRLSNLRWDTPRANKADAFRNGKIKVGAESGVSKLSAEDVLEIVRRCRAGERQRVVAERFGIGVPNITSIMSGKSWNRVTGFPPKRPGKPTKPRTLIPDAEVRAIFSRFKSGESQTSIARSLGIPIGTIGSICRGWTRNEVTGLPKVRNTGGSRRPLYERRGGEVGGRY